MHFSIVRLKTSTVYRVALSVLIEDTRSEHRKYMYRVAVGNSIRDDIIDLIDGLSHCSQVIRGFLLDIESI
jgi:hypothetical protein